MAVIHVKRAAARPERPEPTEEAIQRAVADLLARTAQPGVAWTHIPNGEARGPGIGGKLKAMGVQPGWPDVLLIRDGQVYGLELKRLRGRVSPAQELAHAELRRAGCKVFVAYGLDEAMAWLKAKELIK